MGDEDPAVVTADLPTCCICFEILGENGGPASLPCGHNGCLWCLTEACHQKAECPQCRTEEGTWVLGVNHDLAQLLEAVRSGVRQVQADPLAQATTAWLHAEEVVAEGLMLIGKLQSSLEQADTDVKHQTALHHAARLQLAALQAQMQKEQRARARAEEQLASLQAPVDTQTHPTSSSNSREESSDHDLDEPFSQAVEQSSAITEQLPTPWQISVQQQRPWSILDHLTWGNFHDIKVKLQLVGSGITEPHVLIDLVNEILDKALAKPQCSGMYASLCQALDSTVPEIVEENPGRSEPKTVRFRRALLNLCQAEYEQLVMQNDKSIEADDSGSKDGQASTRGPGIMRFIGFLFMHGVLNARIIHTCIQGLICKAESCDVMQDLRPKADAIDALAQLLQVVGARLDPREPRALTHQHEPHHQHGHSAQQIYMNKYFCIIARMSTDPKVEFRLQNVLKDLIVLRHSSWVHAHTTTHPGIGPV